MSIVIRPYQSKDFDKVRLICIATSDIKVRSEQRRMFILKMYCDYYIECEPDNCFVAVDCDENGEEKDVVGYILCAEDCEKYLKRFMEKYFPKIKEISKLDAYTARAEKFILGRHAAFFPAHMHIDILPAYQRQGIGTMLLNALTDRLKEKKIKGVMLIAGKKNIKGCSFYRKHGFSEIGKAGSGIVFGLDL